MPLDVAMVISGLTCVIYTLFKTWPTECKTIRQCYTRNLRALAAAVITEYNLDLTTQLVKAQHLELELPISSDSLSLLKCCLVILLTQGICFLLLIIRLIKTHRLLLAHAVIDFRGRKIGGGL